MVEAYTFVSEVAVVPNSIELHVHLPHPIPYQGSKRALATLILDVIGNRKFRRFYEPFAGSAAMTIAASHLRLADKYIIGDSLAPLMAIWQQILSTPEVLSSAYERLWLGQLESDTNYYYGVRDRYNYSYEPGLLLYLLARCVKNAPRFNQEGEFNQSYDKRRLGMHPSKMYREIFQASLLLYSRTTAVCEDFENVIEGATAQDIVYMDPPYEGTSIGDNKRYHQGLSRERLMQVLDDLNRRDVPFLLSYDGRCGEKTYGTPLPERLNLTRIELNAGRSSQATLNGKNDVTVESLYTSHHFL